MLPSFQPASPFSFGLFLFVVFALIGMWFWTLLQAERNRLGKSAPRNGALFFFFGSNAMAVFFAFSRMGTDLMRTLSIFNLVVFQAFRILLESVLHLWAREGVIPETMSWHGQLLRER